jgi:hypothetical protein
VIFVKGVLGGVAAVVVMWIVTIAVYMFRSTKGASHAGNIRLTSVAGGWTYLLHLPLVIGLLTVAFGVGLWLAARWG